ncbi:MAG: type II toxin-antitoxin system HipA family toxin [Lacunisphaera sp.]|nr:type II toxin-antitoxin system HipA family toxin [Lacunisphaera sp.]
MSRASAPALNIRWYDGRLVGRVVTTGPTYFAYADEWLAGGHNLSPLAVPFANTAFRQRADGFDQLPGFLSDCLPDQWGRRIMDREFSALDVRATPMRMLAWVGRRGIGALNFEPALDGGHSASSWEAVTSVLLTREAQAVMREEPARAFQHLQHAGTAGGALPKATVARLPDGTLLVGGDVAAAATAHPDARLGILKLDCEDNPAGRVTDGRLEHAYMIMARASGIRTATTEIITDATDTRPFHHLFVERFDCLRGTSRRFHLVTLAGVLHTHRLTYSNLLLTTRQLTQDQTEVSEAVRRMIFNVRSANADDHGKNHSFLFDDTARRWTLSPAYDLTPKAESGRQYQGLSPNTFGLSPRLATLAGVSADAGVRRDEFDAIDAEVTATIQRWPEFAASANLAPEVIERVTSIHAGLATTLASETPAKRGKRRKLWE